MSSHPFKPAMLCALLRDHYQVQDSMIMPVQGGWSAYAFMVKAKDKRYFLKAYDRRRASTLRAMPYIDTYAAFLASIPDSMRCRVPKIIPTIKGHFYSSDTQGCYILHEFIEGEVLLTQQLTKSDMRQLATFLTALHQLDPILMGCNDAVGANIGIDLIPIGLALLNSPNRPRMLEAVIEPYHHWVNRLATDLYTFQNGAHYNTARKVLCHQDLHQGNLMRGSQGLIIIDWEGLMLAPKEADLMFMRGQSYEAKFFHHYGVAEPIDPALIAYFKALRLLDDIFEWLESACEEAPFITSDTLASLAEVLNIGKVSFPNGLLASKFIRKS